jgi:hypothetical protein
LLGAGGGAFHVLAYMHVIWIGNGFLVLRSTRDDELKGSFENTSSVQWSRSGDMVDYDILLRTFISWTAQWAWFYTQSAS